MQIGNVAGSFRAMRVIVLASVTCVLSAAPVTAQTLVVNTGIDELGVDPGNGRCETVPGNGICTLRRAFLETRIIFSTAPSPQPSVVIVLDVPDGVIRIGTRLWEFLIEGPNFEPVRGALTIIGAGASSTVINANGAVFLQTSAALTMSGLTIRRAGSFAILASGPTRLDHVTIEDGLGLGFFYNGPLATLTECEFSRNLGGAIENSYITSRPDTGILRLRRTILRDNGGPAIRALSGTVDLDGVTLVDNHATGSGGAIAMTHASALKAVNTTFTGNTADGSGGALFVEGTASATLAHTTFFGNAADANRDGFGAGGAIASTAVAPASSTVVTHSVFAGNTASTLGPDGWIITPGACSGTADASGPNLFDLVDCTVTGVTPTIAPANLGPLQDNGGSTPTHLPVPGSPAIDAGQTGPCVATDSTALDRDQRGRRRPAGPACDLGAVEAGGAIVPKATRYDLNGDGKSDLLWEHTTLPWRGAWLMNGAVTESLAVLPIDDPLWNLVASDDLDGDGKSDVVWRHQSTGHIAIWLMDGLAIREAAILPVAAFGWRFAGTGDVNGDGRADLVWEQEPRGSGAAGVWFMDGLALKGFRRWQDVPGWSIAGVADANADGTADLLWQHTRSGDLALWVMANGTPASGALLPSTSPSGWAIAGFEDLNGDRKADIVWRDDPLHAPGTAIWLLDGATILTTGHLPLVPDALWMLAQVRDTDGDGRADLIWRGRDPQGQNARWRMDGLTLQAVELLTSVPDPGWRIR